MEKMGMGAKKKDRGSKLTEKSSDEGFLHTGTPREKQERSKRWSG